MEIIRVGSTPSRKGPTDWFTGTVRIDPLFNSFAPERVQGANVTFEPGALTAWHTHPLGQTLVVVSGAAALHLASLGASVVLGARRIDRIEKLAVAITETGGKALPVAVDVTRRDQVQNLIDRAVESYGRVDVLINNAGLMPLSPLEDLKFDEWDRMIDVNLKGVLNGIAAALPHMRAQKSGQIITTASVAAYKVGPTFAVYSATKFALRGLMEGLRLEVKPYNIRTTLLSPGAVKTELLDHISDEGIQAGNRDYVGKVGIAPESYASIAAFLISQPADVDINEIIFRPTAQEM